MNSKSMDAEPSLSADGNLIAFASDRPGGRGGRDIYLFDRAADRFVELPGLNTAAHEYSPSLSPDGRFLVFVSERLGGEGERDIYLYDRQAQKLLPTPGLNSKTEDFDPCVVVLDPGRQQGRRPWAVPGTISALVLAQAAGDAPDWTRWRHARSVEVLGKDWPADQVDYPIRIDCHKGKGADGCASVFLGDDVRDDFGDVRFRAGDGQPLDYWM